MPPRFAVSLIVLLLAPGCDDGPDGQLNDAANYRDNISAKNRPARREGTLSIDPTPFARGARVAATAQFDQPALASSSGTCAESDLREYRLKFVALDESGAVVPTLATFTTAPYGQAAKGVRAEVAFAEAIVPSRPAPRLRAIASFYERYCAQSSTGGAVQTSEVTLAHADFAFACGSETADRCAYRSVGEP